VKKLRVVFVCIGNACRSQMAEGFARTYGGDVLEVHSAGLYPAIAVPLETRRCMLERSIDISQQFPKEFRLYPIGFFDLVVNMSGQVISGHPSVLVWNVNDPYGSNHRIYRSVRDQIEQLVINLILEIRRQNGRTPEEP
jgi:arsenate reductase